MLKHQSKLFLTSFLHFDSKCAAYSVKYHISLGEGESEVFVPSLETKPSPEPQDCYKKEQQGTKHQEAGDGTDKKQRSKVAFY